MRNTCSRSVSRFCFGGDSPHGLALERDPIGVVHQPVEDRVGVGGFTDHFVPEIHGQLAGHDGGPAVVTVVEDVEQVAALGAVSFASPQSSIKSTSVRASFFIIWG